MQSSSGICVEPSEQYAMLYILIVLHQARAILDIGVIDFALSKQTIDQQCIYH